LSTNSELANRFAAVASQFCSIVESANTFERMGFAVEIYRLLPKLIDEAIGLPDVATGDSPEVIEQSIRQGNEEWNRLYTLLKEKLGEWDAYRNVFDPTRDTEAICGSLADDIADIYRDLNEGLALMKNAELESEEAIWAWRFAFHSHWGKHAIDALLTIHFLLQNSAYFE